MGTSDVQGKHKKQSGGAGQYGGRTVRFSPAKETSSSPKSYLVEQSLRAMFLQCWRRDSSES